MRPNNKDNALKRKRLWDNFGWAYRGLGYLSKNHSLKCGCAMCRYITYRKKRDARRGRRKAKDDLRKMLIATFAFFALVASCDTPPHVDPCYECVITQVWQRCDTMETITITEPARCDWTEDEIRQYEGKSTFIIDEKCFLLTQTCECEPTNNTKTEER